MTVRTAFLPRALHPGAWWVWALGLAVAASRTTNPLLLLLVIAVAGYVVAARRTDAPWARSYAAFLRLGLAVIAVRVLLEVVLGGAGTGTVLLRLPEVPLPGFLAGVRLGGPLTADGLLTALYEGLRLAALLACVGAANALANPSRLLRLVPGALYEVGIAVVVAMTLAPQMVTDVGRVRRARRLRGRPDRGPRALAGVALPVLEGALDRALQVAAAMDSRGYGRSAGLPARTRRLTAVLVLAGLSGAALGAYGLLDGGSPAVADVPLLGVPLLVLGTASATLGLVLGGRRVTRSRYRPDRWLLPEWLVSLSGVAAGAATVVAAAWAVPGLVGPISPPAWPALPLLPAAGVLLGLLPAWVAPPVPSRRPAEAETPVALPVSTVVPRPEQVTA